jgi:mannose-6-phosphate isomerase-like protein (cupin superfamily)
MDIQMLEVVSKEDLKGVVDKKWGRETTIVNSEKYCGKLLQIKRGFFNSLHRHKTKEETFYVQRGTILLTYVARDKDFVSSVNQILSVGDSITIPPMTWHMIEGITKVEVFEFSTTHKEDDVERW